MKIFFTTTKHGIDSDLDQVCPFNNKIEGRDRVVLVGSNSCARCPYCYGYGQHPNPWHKLMILPAYSIYSDKNENRDEREIADEGLKNYKFVSECDYVKCMMAYSEYGRKMFKNRFKLWYWKHIGERLSTFRYIAIEKYVDLKVKFSDLKYKIGTKFDRKR